MASLRDIRSRIASVKSTQQVTRAMKMVAAAKLRRAQERMFKMRPYAFSLGGLIHHLRAHADPEKHPLFQDRPEVNRVLLVIVTADRGMAGGFNANIIKLAEQTIHNQYARYFESGNLDLICIGRKGHEYFSKRGYNVIGTHTGIFDKLEFYHAQQIADEIVTGYLGGTWDEVKLIYNEFRNTLSQNQIVEPFLPIPSERFLTPVMELSAEQAAVQKGGKQVDYIFEPGAEAILNEIVPRYLRFDIMRAMLESNAAEQGARMVAMDNATSNAEELLKELHLRYNRARQDAITTEIIEITSGANALESA